MVDGNLRRAPVPACIVGQWLDVFEKSLGTTKRIPRVDIWCDGWYKELNPVAMRAGYSFRAVVDGAVFPTQRGFLLTESKRQPVNVAEYVALIRALQWAQRNGFRGNIIAHTDSQTVWGQITQAWSTNAHKFPQIGCLWAEASQLLDEVDGRLVKEPRILVEALLGH